MKLKLLLPSEVLLEEEVVKIGAESAHGAFTILPRHIDCSAILHPGLLSFETVAGAEEFLAIDEGVLVKCGEQVLVSTSNAVYGPNLEELRETVQTEFQSLNREERKARAALARIEADFVRRYLEIGN